jgi:hypothetical protein
MLSTEELSRFGIELKDEYAHDYSQDHSDWNESYFFDWYDAEAAYAGHCRVGWHPVQQRILFWLYLYNGHEWLMIEENRLPFSALDLSSAAAFHYDQWGLQFSYVPEQPLQSGKLKVSGFARVISGLRLAQVLPVSLELNIKAIGPAYSRGAGTVEDHSAEGFNTNRYEQPHQSTGLMTIDNIPTELKVRGERDHSWGPRPWDMQWQFLVINNEHFSLLATIVQIPEWPLIKMGYYHAHDQEMEHLSEAEFDLNFDADNTENAVNGRFHLRCDSGRIIKGEIESITGTEIDITHVFAEPKRSEYRRSLIRCHFDNRPADAASSIPSESVSQDEQNVNSGTSIGWLECNRTPGEA